MRAREEMGWRMKDRKRVKIGWKETKPVCFALLCGLAIGVGGGTS